MKKSLLKVIRREGFYQEWIKVNCKVDLLSYVVSVVAKAWALNKKTPEKLV